MLGAALPSSLGIKPAIAQQPGGGLAMPSTQGLIANGTAPNPFISNDIMTTPTAAEKKTKKRDGAKKVSKVKNAANLIPETEIKDANMNNAKLRA